MRQVCQAFVEKCAKEEVTGAWFVFSCSWFLLSNPGQTTSAFWGPFPHLPSEGGGLRDQASEEWVSGKGLRPDV